MSFLRFILIVDCELLQLKEVTVVGIEIVVVVSMIERKLSFVINGGKRTKE